MYVCCHQYLKFVHFGCWESGKAIKDLVYCKSRWLVFFVVLKRRGPPCCSVALKQVNVFPLIRGHPFYALNLHWGNETCTCSPSTCFHKMNILCAHMNENPSMFLGFLIQLMLFSLKALGGKVMLIIVVSHHNC